MSRTRKIAIGAFVLLLALAPFVPRGDDDDGALTPSATRTGDAARAQRRPPAAAGSRRRCGPRSTGSSTTGRTVGRIDTDARPTPSSLAAGLVRCADFEGQRYCLGTGWTDAHRGRRAGPGRHRRPHARPRARRAAESTGDLDPLATLARGPRH